MPNVHDVYRKAQVAEKAVETVDASAYDDELRAAWKDPSIPSLQSKVSDLQIKEFLAGNVDPVFESLVSILRLLPEGKLSFLDAACATGYYGVVVKKRFPELRTPVQTIRQR